MLFNQGTLIVPASRRPEVVAQAIETQRVQALTTSPTFLNLLIYSGALDRFDLSSLQVVNYGTEPMPERVLERLSAALPATRFSQAYGLTETGIVPTRSEASTSNWMRIGDASCDIRVVDGLLEVRGATTMLGYLNAESPFTADGYLKTGDAVVQKGDLYRIVARGAHGNRDISRRAKRVDRYVSTPPLLVLRGPAAVGAHSAQNSHHDRSIARRAFRWQRRSAFKNTDQLCERPAQFGAGGPFAHERQ